MLLLRWVIDYSERFLKHFAHSQEAVREPEDKIQNVFIAWTCSLPAISAAAKLAVDLGSRLNIWIYPGQPGLVGLLAEVSTLKYTFDLFSRDEKARCHTPEIWDRN
jgi:hypothetical protein